VWKGSETLTVVQRTTARTTGFYVRNIGNPAVWRRFVRGRINVRGITLALVKRATRQLVATVDLAIAAMKGETEVGMVRRQLRELSAGSVRILYMLSGNDPGLDETPSISAFVAGACAASEMCRSIRSRRPITL